MEFEDFMKYVEENSSAKDKFFTKVTKYLKEQVASNDNKVVLTKSQIESEVKKAWNNAIKNMYDKVNSKVKTKKTDAYEVKVEKWIATISELEILDNFTESIDEMEFE